MQKDKGLCFFLVTLSLFLAGCPQRIKTKTKVNPVKIISGFSSPESVLAGPEGKFFFVSNLGKKLAPSTQDNDGFISKLSWRGEVLSKKYFPKIGILHSPKGMAIIGQTLYVTDIDRVLGYDLETREQNFELDFSSEKTVFLNDLAVFDPRTLFVSATDTGKIYKISLAENPSFSLLVKGISGPNGLYFEENTQRLFVVGFGEGTKANGELGVISLREQRPKYQRLTGKIGALDGIAFLSDSRILFSDWVAFDRPGRMRVYDLKTKKLSVYPLAEEVHGPADFFYDQKNNTLWIPRMLEGKIMLEKID